MSYSFKSKSYMTVSGLIKALCKDSNAVECSMVVNNQITTYSSRNVPAQVYDVTPPKFGQLQFVTRRA